MLEQPPDMQLTALDFTKPLKGYEGITAQCQNCGNWSAHPIQSWDWFTFCWVPVIPLGGKHQDVCLPPCINIPDLANRFQDRLFHL